MPYCQIPWKLGWNVSETAIRKALKREGVSRRLSYRKPIITEINRVKRFEWAREHLIWNKEQWESILWSDETWVNGTRHRRIWVTRRAGEELNPTCVIPRLPGKGGWMFWGCFSGSRKDLVYFGEKTGEALINSHDDDVFILRYVTGRRPARAGKAI